VLAIMPTGAGKTTGIILPTLLTSPEPAFVLDPKGELWHRSAGWRAGRGHRCLRFSPTAASPTETLAWNPLDEVRRGPGEMHDLAILAENLVTVPAYLGHNHWTLSAQRLFQLLALHLLYASEHPSLGQLRQLLNHPAKSRYGLFRALLTYDHDGAKTRGWHDPGGRDTATHPEVALLARSFLNTPDRELGSIVSTLQTYLQPWANPAVALNTATSDFSLANFTRRGTPVTLYVALPYHDLETLAPLLRMMLALLIRRLTDDHAGGRTGRTLFLLDEFASLGRLPILEKMLSFFRGYGVRAVLVIQDLGSLTKLYSGAETLSANCAVHVAAATQSGRTRDHVSQLAGDTTVRYRHRSLSGGRGSMFLSKATFSDAEARRALLTPAEVGLLPRDRMILLKTGLPPVLAHRLPYFEDGELSRRARERPPSFISARPSEMPPLPDLPGSMKQDQGVRAPEDERRGGLEKPGGLRGGPGARG
jgi:type IV secretion system protein VirD4